jgi:hypothetical protein
MSPWQPGSDRRPCPLRLQSRAQAWAAVIAALRAPRTVVFAHLNLGLSGHYALVAGAVGPALDKRNPRYEPGTCALFTNTVSQVGCLWWVAAGAVCAVRCDH